jgi:hypothetical protein
MTDVLQHPHPEVPFASVGDDTISSLAELAAIFKLKLHQTPSPTPRAGATHIFQRPCLAELSDQIINSPLPASRRTRSQTTIHTQAVPTVSSPLRVVTPRSLRPSPPRVPTPSQSLSPRNLSQYNFCKMDTSNIAISLGNNHLSQQHQANAVLHPITGKERLYAALMKDPRLQQLWTRGFGNTCKCLFQGIRDIPVIDTCFFIKMTNIPKDRKITHRKSSTITNPTSKKRNPLGSPSEATNSTTQATSPHQPQISRHSQYLSTARSPPRTPQ